MRQSKPAHSPHIFAHSKMCIRDRVYDAAHLGEGLPAHGKVLILRAETGSPALTAALDRRAISYDDIAVYRTAYQLSLIHI